MFGPAKSCFHIFGIQWETHLKIPELYGFIDNYPAIHKINKYVYIYK